MRIRFFNMFLFVAMLGIVISSCKTPTGQAQRDLEQEYLSKYIAKFHPTVTPKASGLYFIETKAGVATDSLIKAGDLVNVYYSGYLIEDDATNGIQDGMSLITIWMVLSLSRLRLVQVLLLPVGMKR